VIRFLTTFGLVVVLYVLAGKAGLTLAFVNASASPVWAPTGIALAALLVLGPRAWPAVFLGAFVVNITTTGSIAPTIGIAAGNTLEALVGAHLVTRFANGVRAFERPRDVLKFTFLAALVATAISATVGATALEVTGQAQPAEALPVWLTWWLGDASGALVVAPLLVLWATDRSSPGRDRRLELAAVFAATILIAVIMFGGAVALSAERYPISFLPFPVLMWAAFRFGPREAATSLAMLSAIAIFGTLHGFGPFGAYAPNDALLLSQGFVAVATLTTLTLAAAVRERDRTQAQLRQAEERLRMAEERKVAEREEFLSIAAHELKTPMTTLRIAVQSLLRDIEREREIEPAFLGRSLTAIRDTTDKLARLATELLETARMQVGHLELDRAEADLVAIVASAVERAQARTRAHKLVLSAPAPPLRANVDALRLEQVFDNVIDNAIKFSPRGGPIEISVARAGATAQLAVRDHGVGIAPERRARIFDRFYQAHVETNRSGLGIGLYVSREIVRLHGGQIAAEFPSDGGTRIVIDLPLNVVSAADRPDAVGSPSR
jgi:signal transduction histidine kinase